jgi:hypothetical protein
MPEGLTHAAKAVRTKVTARSRVWISRVLGGDTLLA